MIKVAWTLAQKVADRRLILTPVSLLAPTCVLVSGHLVFEHLYNAKSSSLTFARPRHSPAFRWATFSNDLGLYRLVEIYYEVLISPDTIQPKS